MAFVISNLSDLEIGVLLTTGVGQQAVWGTAGIDSLDALQLSGKIDTIDEDNQTFESDGALTGTRSDDKVNHHTTVYGSAPIINYSTKEKGVLKDEIAYFLYSHLQSVVEGGTPFLKTITPHATQPDFTANAGFFQTIVLKQPSVANSYKLADVIACEKLGFTLPMGGYLQMSATLRSRGGISATANPSGTWTPAASLEAATASDLFHANNMICKIDYGSEQTIDVVGDVSWETAWRDMSKQGQDSGTGNFKSWMLANFGGTISIPINYDAYGRAIRDELADNDDVILKVTIGWDGDGDSDMAGDADGDLKFEFYVHAKKCNPLGDVSAPYGFLLEGAIVGDIANSYDAMTAYVVDLQDMGW